MHSPACSSGFPRPHLLLLTAYPLSCQCTHTPAPSLSLITLLCLHPCPYYFMCTSLPLPPIQCPCPPPPYLPSCRWAQRLTRRTSHLHAHLCCRQAQWLIWCTVRQLPVTSSCCRWVIGLVWRTTQQDDGESCEEHATQATMKDSTTGRHNQDNMITQDSMAIWCDGDEDGMTTQLPPDHMTWRRH